MLSLCTMETCPGVCFSYVAKAAYEKHFGNNALRYMGDDRRRTRIVRLRRIRLSMQFHLAIIPLPGYNGEQHAFQKGGETLAPETI